ncbi:MAG: translation initiation factor IF-3 [Deltaproteobacteria bacterium]|nr:translation initiation factor IF-3 [Deltaproteobacteria bacterium]
MNSFDRRSRGPKEPATKINRQIRARELRVIGDDGEQLGILSLNEAIELAENNGLDLVEVSSTSRPPVCRIMDYGKFKYNQKKKERSAKRHQASQQMKEVKLRPKTEEHDYNFKLKHITRFLMEGNKVKVTVRFRGREMAHKGIGVEYLNRISKDVGDLAQVTSPPSMEGRLLHMVLAPSPKALVIKRSKDEERARAKESKQDKDKDSNREKDLKKDMDKTDSE